MAAPKGVMMSEGSLRPPMGIKIFFRELFRTADARKNNDRSTNRQYPDRAILFKFFP
ncbi:hypothetical protein JCM18918_508 [Cutibacterium acnes JCM 18918]|nr:hypothetical protein JCM18918_508 [Cutibacterium acnes JCM 18918]